MAQQQVLVLTDGEKLKILIDRDGRKIEELSLAWGVTRVQLWRYQVAVKLKPKVIKEACKILGVPESIFDPRLNADNLLTELDRMSALIDNLNHRVQILEAEKSGLSDALKILNKPLLKSLGIKHRNNIKWTSKTLLNSWATACPNSKIFLFVPFVASIGLYFLNGPIDGSTVPIVIASMSIFIALFFNVNILLIDMKRRAGENRDRVEAYLETQSCISFLIILGLFSIIALYGALCSSSSYLKIAFNLLSYYFLGVFFLTITMTIKNVHVLFDDDLTRGR